MLTFIMSTSAAPGLYLDPSVGARVLGAAAARHRKSSPPGDPFRVWVPRCGGGEDAYSVAIALLKGLGGRWRETPLRVLATESDENVLFRAREGEYPAEKVRGLTKAELMRFFEVDGDRVRARGFVKETCRFLLRADYEAGAPASNLGAIVCRETLAPLPAPARRAALRTFRGALAPEGILLERSGAAAASPELFAILGRSSGAQAYRARSHARPERRRGKEDKFHLLFSKMDEALLMRELRTGRILHANGTAELLFGWTSDELVGMKERDILAEPADVRLPDAERRSEARLSLPHFRRKGGALFPADVTRLLMTFQGRSCELVLVRDATARLRASHGRSREDAKDAFVGEVMHELRSPISIIKISAEALRGGCAKSERADLLGFIENNSQRLADLVDRLLDLSAADGKRSVRPERVLLAEAVWQTAAAHVPAAKKRGVSLTIDIPGELAVRADPADLPHVFGNLIDNAVKFTPRGGKVRVQARVEAGEAILTVRDSGPGIPPEDLLLVFDRFFRSKRTSRTKGTGLGLAIVKAIVAANGGQVSARNDPAGGAVFRVSLPLSES